MCAKLTMTFLLLRRIILLYFWTMFGYVWGVFENCQPTRAEQSNGLASLVAPLSCMLLSILCRFCEWKSSHFKNKTTRHFSYKNCGRSYPKIIYSINKIKRHVNTISWCDVIYFYVQKQKEICTHITSRLGSFPLHTVHPHAWQLLMMCVCVCVCVCVHFWCTNNNILLLIINY
jgi:hypothetical protein